MKHATAQALDQLEPLLADLRGVSGLKERSRGVFYRGSKAFLHFHEDSTGLFADIRGPDGEFERMPVNKEAEHAALLARVRAT